MNIFESLSFDRMEVGRLYSIYIYIYISKRGGWQGSLGGCTAHITNCRDHSVDALLILRTRLYIYIYMYIVLAGVIVPSMPLARTICKVG